MLNTSKGIYNSIRNIWSALCTLHSISHLILSTTSEVGVINIPTLWENGGIYNRFEFFHNNLTHCFNF